MLSLLTHALKYFTKNYAMSHINVSANTCTKTWLCQWALTSYSSTTFTPPLLTLVTCMVYCITHPPSLDYMTTLPMVTCMMIMSVGSEILLLHHIYSSTSNLGHEYGLLYYSSTLSRLYNHLLYGHVNDDYVSGFWDFTPPPHKQQILHF